ncbi:hypothetical protein QYH69_32460 [Paraburkholderia sp. SARCC-3016]|uniref:hypothetical protein n=1 Tax=Paraburkholderia sp. SARCC-3016 TaxID=3058611 RepID=UPI0028087577|nr:hypothetical protein [Paraburkholderia sp. SARCC-3016]MDQ7981938.1 hypothetical protein [Paraburkholderia sp. SARCC-3016]
MTSSADKKQLADWLLVDPETGAKLTFAGPLERDFLGLSRVKMTSEDGAVWTLTAGLKEGYLTASERMANLRKAVVEESASDAATDAQRDAKLLSDADIDTIATSMPGGLTGFMKGWGWRQFARAVERESIVLNDAGKPSQVVAVDAPEELPPLGKTESTQSTLADKVIDTLKSLGAPGMMISGQRALNAINALVAAAEAEKAKTTALEKV